MVRVVAAIAITVLSAPLCAQAPKPRQTPVDDVIPRGSRTTQIAITTDARRVYYGDSLRAIWFYDRTDKRNVRIGSDEVWDLTLSPTGNALAYSRTAPGTAEHHVWILPLDSRTGLAAGPERRASAMQGDAPSISADGKMLAFARDDSTGVGQSIVVVPMAGGRERTVAASVHTGVSNIRWSPDGRSLFFGVNPPVACNPDWSCLPLKPEFQQTTGSVRRVALSGGAPAIVAPKAASGWPGLSADGSVLAYVDTGFPVRIVFADTTGHTLQSFALPPRQTVEGWLNASTLVFSDRGDVRRLRAYSLSNGSTKLLIDSVQQLAEPSWSPDAQMISTVHCAPDRCDLRIGRADGSEGRLVELPDRYGVGNIWSPDQRLIAYIGGPPNGERHVNIVDVATGHVTSLTAFRSNPASLLWLPDSRGVVVSMTLGTGATRREAFERVGIDGQVRALREFVIGAPPSGGAAITSTTAVLIRGGEVRRVVFDGDSSDVVLLPKTAEPYGALSLSEERLAFRKLSDSNDQTVIEVMNADGSGRVTIDLPFGVFSGANNRRFLPGGKQLVVLGGPTASESEAAAYLVTVETKSVQKLFTIPLRSFTGELSLSPDGRTILYVTGESATPRVFTMDLSSLRRE